MTIVSVTLETHLSRTSLLIGISTLFKNQPQCHLLFSREHLWRLQVTRCPACEHLYPRQGAEEWAAGQRQPDHVPSHHSTGHGWSSGHPPLQKAQAGLTETLKKSLLAEWMNALKVLVMVKHSLWNDSFKWSPNWPNTSQRKMHLLVPIGTLK